MQVKKQQLVQDMEQQTGSKLGKEYDKVVSLCLFNFYTEYIMWNVKLDESQAESNIARKNSNNLRYADDTTLMAESKQELKNLLMKEESEKSGLKLIEKSKIMAFGPITSWHIDEEKVEAVSDFIYLCSKMSEDSDCSHEIKRRLLLRGKATTNLGSILKSKDITLSTKLCLVKAMIFPVVIYRYKHWTIKKAEGQRIDT